MNQETIGQDKIGEDNLENLSRLARIFKWLFAVFAVLAGLILLLILVKILQTPEFMLRYDDQTHYEQGMMGSKLLLAGVMALVFGFLTLGFGKKSNKARTELIGRLRTDQGRTQSDTKRMSIEPRHRELGARVLPSKICCPHGRRLC